MAQDPYRYFRIEAREVIEQLGAGVLALEKTGGDAELVSRLLRLAHTIKGAARIVKQREIADLAHRIEDVLGPLRGGTVPPGRRDDLLALIDGMTAHLAELPKAPEVDAPARPRDDIPALPRTDTSSIDELIGALAEIHAQINRLQTTPSLDALGPRVERLDRELRQVRLDAERLRLMPAGAVFGALERTARDAALGGKQIAFTAHGSNVRVDATVLTALHGALVQLVRNAIAHGIETPDARRTAGKPAEGRVDVDVTLRGTRASFACRDDGRGIDITAVRRAAVKRDPKASSLDDDQLVALLLRGGLTTSTTVTEIAGRGIGLDVVREAAAKLGGEVTATSTPGAGTTMVITVPVSSQPFRR